MYVYDIKIIKLINKNEEIRMQKYLACFVSLLQSYTQGARNEFPSCRDFRWRKGKNAVKKEIHPGFFKKKLNQTILSLTNLSNSVSNFFFQLRTFSRFGRLESKRHFLTNIDINWNWITFSFVNLKMKHQGVIFPYCITDHHSIKMNENHLSLYIFMCTALHCAWLSFVAFWINNLKFVGIYIN